MILFIQYPNCSTCQKAKKWLVEHNVSFTDRHIVEDNPSAKELSSWIKTSGLPVKKFFNTSGMKYKEMSLKDRLPSMSEEEQIALLSTDGMLVGVITDVAGHFSRVRALTDSNTNIAVRIAGSEVYAFLRGNGSDTPTIGLFSDPEFQPSAGIKLITSNISGVLPNGIIVGETINETDVKIRQPDTLSRVIVLQFDAQNEYN